jgi:hypothetical protein
MTPSRQSETKKQVATRTTMPISLLTSAKLDSAPLTRMLTAALITIAASTAIAPASTSERRIFSRPSRIRSAQ